MEEIKQTWEERFDKQSNEKHFGIRSFIRSEIALAVKQERERFDTLLNEKVAEIEKQDWECFEQRMIKKDIIAILKQ